jgi:hypothetical protein
LEAVKAQRIRRSPWVTAASCIPWALVPVAVLASLFTHMPFAAITPHLAIGGLFVFLNVWRRKPRARLEPVHVATDASSMLVDDERIPRDAIKRAELVPWINNTIVHASLRGRLDEEIVFDEENDAHAFLKQLGFDPSQTTASYRLASLAVTRYRWVPFAFIPFFLLLIVLGGALHVNLAAVFPLALIALVPLMLAPAKVTVGVDGLLVKWLWLREFVATKDIVFVKRFDTGSGKSRRRGIDIALPGRTVQLPMYSDEAIATLEQRIRDVIALARESTHVGEEALALARGELGVREWMAQLKALGAGATATLRTAAVMPEHLWRVAEDPAQPPIKRAAAAIALAPSLGETDKERLSELAKTTAAPKLRVALERVAEDASDADVEEALKELEA